MLKNTALALILTMGVATANSGTTTAAALSSAEFDTMIENIHSEQARQRADVSKIVNANHKTAGKSPAEFQRMIDNIHASQAQQRLAISEIVRKNERVRKQIAKGQ